MAEWLPEQIIILIVSAIAAALASGFAVKVRYRKTTLSNSQNAENAGVNLREISNSTIQIQTVPLEPVKVASDNKAKSVAKDWIRDLLKRIGKEKVSILLQEAKLVALDAKDKEMEQWIEQELAGYAPNADVDGTDNKELAKKVPEYRRVKGKFLLQFGDNGKLEELDFPFKMGHAITSIESLIDTLLKGGVIVTQTVTLPKDFELIGGKKQKVELTLEELQGVKGAVERRLSQYLEAKLIQ